MNQRFKFYPLVQQVAQGAAAFTIALVLLSAGINAPFAKDQEPQSAQWVVDIVQHGHWLLPYDYYGYVERKPPLLYWLDAVAVELSGGRLTEALARLPSLISGAALAAEVMLCTASSIDQPTGWLAMLFLLGMYGFASRAALALTDMLMTFLLLTAYYLLAPLLEGQVVSRRAAACGMLLGLGVLTKGPVVIVLVALAACVYCLSLRSNPLPMLTRSWPWMVVTIALGIAALWYVPAFVAGRRSDLAAVFVDENFGHFLPASMGGTGEASRPFYYIAVRLLGGTLPLCLLLPPYIIALPRLCLRARHAVLYQAAMVLAVLLIFSVASAKRDDYILPAIPPLAIMSASLFSSAMRSQSPRMLHARRLRDAIAGVIALAAGLTALAALILLPAGFHAGDLNLQSSDASFAMIFMSGVARFEAPFIGLLAAVIIGAGLSLAALWRGRDHLLGFGLALIAIAMTLTWTGLLKPREAATRSLRIFAAQVHQRAGTVPVYIPLQDPEFAYYFGRGVPPLPRPLARGVVALSGPIYFVARPTQLFVLGPAVRQRLIPILHADAIGGGGSPELYLLNPLK